MSPPHALTVHEYAEGRIDRRRFLTVAQVAEMWAVSTDKVYRDCRKGALPYYTVQGAIRIRERDALAYGQPVDVTQLPHLPQSPR
jgi:excisionase family DNA binding protein